MKEEIKQNGKTVLYSYDGFSMPMLFNNLGGKNFSGEEYHAYLKHIAFKDMGFIPGRIELYRNGALIRVATIPELC